jgi:hypothetical protein
MKKVALEYSGYLRFIQHTFPNISQYIQSNEPIEFYFIVHTWDCSKPEDIDYLKNVVKPHRLYIDSQKNFERHPYYSMNVDMASLEHDKDRLEHNIKNPHDIKEYFEKPSSSNNFSFSKDLEIMRFGETFLNSHYPYNVLCQLYSIHQVSMLRRSFAQENNINFDYIIRIRSDMHFTTPIFLNTLDNTKVTVFEAHPHGGPCGKYTIHDQFAVGITKYMNIYSDLFIFLPAYYFIFKLDWISEILLGFHLKYNEIPINKIKEDKVILRYAERNIYKRPTQ